MGNNNNIMLTLLIFRLVVMGRKYAVLINGADESRYHDNIEAIYDTLLDLGFSKDGVHILDRPSGRSYPIRAHPTKTGVKSIFSRLEKEIGKDDTLVVHIDDHGELTRVDHEGRDEGVVGVVLNRSRQSVREEYLTEIELDRMLSGVHAGLTVVTTDICYGGRLARRVGHGRCVGISAGGLDEIPRTLNGMSFSSYFYSAFSSTELMQDGVVNLKVAFQHASRRYKNDDALWLCNPPDPIPTPQIFSQMDPSRLTI